MFLRSGVAVTSREHGAACEAIVHPTERLASRQETREALVVASSPTVNPMAAAHAFLELEAFRPSGVEDLVVCDPPRMTPGCDKVASDRALCTPRSER